MLEFLNGDSFTLLLEVVFLVFIVYDLKRYFQTKKREYVINIVLTFIFFVWAIIPFYNTYITWNQNDKSKLLLACKEESNQKLCECIDEKIFKEYSFKDFKTVDKESSDFKEFQKEAKGECLDDGWF